MKNISHFRRTWLFGALVLLVTGGFVAGRSPGGANGHEPVEVIQRTSIANAISVALKDNSFPVQLNLPFNGELKNFWVQYALQEEAQTQVEKLFQTYKPDYGAFVALDAVTGRVLSMHSYSRMKPEMHNLSLSASFPAASIFKVVTATAAIDLKKASADTIVPFDGRLHTLYRKNVSETKNNRWTRHMTIREAFGRSVNTVFGKLGLFYVGPENLLSYAQRFMFNQPVPTDMPFEVGNVVLSPDDPWSVVTAASGFTQDNTLSPMHGAMIAAAIANDGVMMAPYLVSSLRDELGQTVYNAHPRKISVVIDRARVDEVQELMGETVRRGTSKKSFRSTLRNARFEDIEFGGKTGSLTGGSPAGKCDWFVGYARLGNQRIAVAALTVNEKNWRVKSSQLASDFFKYHFRHVPKGETIAATTRGHR